MRSSRLVVSGLLLSLAGCIDLEGAYAECVDAGRCGDQSGTDGGSADSGQSDAGRVDAGVTDAGGVDAGTPDAGPLDAGNPDAGNPDAGNPDAGTPDAGTPDAGPPDAGPQDAGLSCPNSPRKVLRCNLPIELNDGGTGVNYGALAALPEGFLAGFTRNLVVVHKVNFDAGVAFEFSRAPTGGALNQLALDSAGNAWVALWLGTNDTYATCMTDRDGSNPQVSATTGSVFRLISAAISPDGGIAVAATLANSGATTVGATGGACPMTMLPMLALPAYARGVSVVSTPAGFRYVYTGLGSRVVGSDAGEVVVGGNNGGPFITHVTGTPFRPDQNEAVASSSGANVLVTFNRDVGTGIQSVRVVGAPASLSGPSGTPLEVSTLRPDWWVIGNCGPGCVVSGVVPYAPNVPVTLSFLTDAVSPVLTRAWDLLCDVPGRASALTTLSLASSGGRLGALVTSPNSAKLYICDLPPTAAP